MVPISLEVFSYVIIPITWYIFKRFADRNVTGDMLAGSIMGAFNEFATEPLWNYHFRFTVYKDIPFALILGWGMMFSLVVFLSEKLYCWILRKDMLVPYDKRIFIFDLTGGMLIGISFEIAGLKFGVWDYNYSVLNWNWGVIPFLNLPYEALIGYALFMLVGPTFVRYWQGSFERR